MKGLCQKYFFVPASISYLVPQMNTKHIENICLLYGNKPKCCNLNGLARSTGLFSDRIYYLEKKGKRKRSSSNNFEVKCA